ncbi:MAG: UbiX family flavin prenyltransferase [Geminicoccaceae bacterium]|mgnify:CR=1 FL=1|nr:UbiX family flavin prenyltransferase [Geminicoccaceae bacterium]
MRRLIVGISGASGVILGERLLRALAPLEIETHLVLTRSAALTATYELETGVEALKALASVVHPIGDVGASIASGSFPTEGMIIVPCSMRTLAAIATGVTDNLLTRAADVVLKERRRLVLMARETPLHLGHLRNMVAVTEMGAIVAPPVPGFYAKPASIEAMVDHTVGRALDLFGIETEGVTRWRAGAAPSAD